MFHLLTALLSSHKVQYMKITSLQYLNFFILFLFICLVVYLLIKLPQLINKYKKNLLKDTVYECGFDAFQSSKVKFNIRFFAIAILFLLFDLEIMLLFPWGIMLRSMPYETGLVAGIIFCLLLLAGFVFEWISGILDLISQDVSSVEKRKIKLFRKISKGPLNFKKSQK